MTRDNKLNYHSSSFLFFFVILSVQFFSSQAFIPCATPCNSPNNCQTSSCDTNEGVCAVYPIFPPPSGCCTENAHCSSSQLCVYASCNFDTNTCSYVPICQGGAPPSAVCQTDDQCKNNDICAQTKCIDNLCHTSPLPSNDPTCCTSTADCPENPCTEKFCNVESFRCFYEPIKGCEVSDYSYVIVPIDDGGASSGGSSSSYKPTKGDIAGAIIGFIILGILVVAFIIVIIMMLIQKVYKKLTSSKEPKN